jgi:hypothetical protein
MAVTSIEAVPHLDDIARVIEAEFDEMPGMRLTYPQVRRLWNLSESECTCALGHLCQLGHLARDSSGRYLRNRSDY